MDYETIRYAAAASGVATIALDQPSTRNALSERVLDELLDAFAAARDDVAVRCVVLASTHETVFSSGGDLVGFAADGAVAEKLASTERLPRLFRLIGELEKPTICAANGHVLAGALGLALACDLIVAKESATFGTPEIAVGLFPFMVMALLYRNVGRKKATELLLLGERIDAREAERIGLVNKVVPAAGFAEAVDVWAAKLASRSPLVMRLGKVAMDRQRDLPLAEALESGHRDLSFALTTDDGREGVRAFLEKREPRWSGH